MSFSLFGTDFVVRLILFGHWFPWDADVLGTLVALMTQGGKTLGRNLVILSSYRVMLSRRVLDPYLNHLSEHCLSRQLKISQFVGTVSQTLQVMCFLFKWSITKHCAFEENNLSRHFLAMYFFTPAFLFACIWSGLRLLLELRGMKVNRRWNQPLCTGHVWGQQAVCCNIAGSQVSCSELLITIAAAWMESFTTFHSPKQNVSGLRITRCLFTIVWRWWIGTLNLAGRGREKPYSLHQGLPYMCSPEWVHLLDILINFKKLIWSGIESFPFH